jgi:hypothetical protein
MGRDGSIAIETCYMLEGLGIDSRWKRDFSAPIQTVSEAQPSSYIKCIGSFPEVKRAGRGVDHPPLSSAVVKVRVELYLYSPSGFSWLVLGWTVTLLSVMTLLSSDTRKHLQVDRICDMSVSFVGNFIIRRGRKECTSGDLRVCSRKTLKWMKQI